jgi:hypothetical protein
VAKRLFVVYGPKQITDKIQVLCASLIAFDYFSERTSASKAGHENGWIRHIDLP